MTQPPLPPGWRWTRLGEVIAQAKVGFASSKRDASGVIQLRMNNVGTRGELIWDEVLRVPTPPQMIHEYALLPGDVVFNNTNSTALVGKSALFAGRDEPVVFSNHFTRLRPNPQCLTPEYLAHWLNHLWLGGLFAGICNRWIGQSAVQRDKLLALEIPLPPIEEQRRIAARLQEQLAHVETARTAVEAQRQALDALPAALLQRAFDPLSPP